MDRNTRYMHMALSAGLTLVLTTAMASGQCFEALELGPSYQSQATGVSDDGEVIVGIGYSDSSGGTFLWTQDGMDIPLDLEGRIGADVSVSSDNGTVVVGYTASESAYEAFRWLWLWSASTHWPHL